MKIFGRKRDGERAAGGYDPAYLGLRTQVLSLTADALAAEAVDAPVFAVLMETGYAQAVASLVGVVDGSTSLYLSNGGGVLGAGEHAHVAEATRGWLDVCRRQIGQLSPTVEALPPPEVGMTQFLAVTPHGLVAAGAPEQELGAGKHALSPLFHAGQSVLTQLRLLDEQSS